MKCLDIKLVPIASPTTGTHLRECYGVKLNGRTRGADLGLDRDGAEKLMDIIRSAYAAGFTDGAGFNG